MQVNEGRGWFVRMLDFSLFFALQELVRIGGRKGIGSIFKQTSLRSFDFAQQRFVKGYMREALCSG